jgi:hypothetical protein
MISTPLSMLFISPMIRSLFLRIKVSVWAFVEMKMPRKNRELKKNLVIIKLTFIAFELV